MKSDYYVYAISDDEGAIRYVGKGKGKRDSLCRARNPLVTALVQSGRAQPALRLIKRRFGRSCAGTEPQFPIGAQTKDRADDGISMRFAPKAINAGFFVSA